MCVRLNEQTPPESVFTSNNKYITNQESKETHHVTTGIRTRASGVPGQPSNQLSYREFDSHTSLFIIIKPNSRTFVCVCPPLRLKVEPVAPELESNVTTNIRPCVIRLGSAIVECWPGTSEVRVGIP